MMKKSATISTVICLTLGLFSTGSRASYVIDADLSDWGVIPFADWVPEGTAEYEETDNVNLYNAAGYKERDDFEALYFDDDMENFYFAVVYSYPLNLGNRKPSLGIDLDLDATISSHGIVTGLEYAVLIDSGLLLEDPTWSDTESHEWPDGWQGSPLEASDGTVIGTVAVVSQFFAPMEEGTYIAEIAIPRDFFPVEYDVGHLITSHITNACGNDSINLTGTVSYIPEPATILFIGFGMGIVSRLRKRKTR
jgi:hypothetical protein